MHSFSRSLLGLGALTLAGCGAPAELDEGRFPGLNETGYADGPSPIGGAGLGSGGAASPPSNAGAPGTSGTGNLPIGGSGNVGQGGSAPAATGGSGPVASGGSAPTGGGGASGSASQGGSEQTGGGSCPDDITVLFARPASAGGCQGGGCHIPDGQKPDLVSPGVEARLVDVVSNCQGLPYIGADESFLEIKLVGPPRCGFAMPLGAAMPEEDKQCVIEWIDEVSGG